MKKAIIFLFTLMLTVTLVACSKDVNYKLTLPDNVNADVTDLNSVKADTLVTLTISEKEGYVVDSLTANDKELVISNNQATFVMVTDTVVKISFKEVELEQLYSLTLPKEVTANITNLDSIKVNTKITLTVNVKDNQVVESFKINGEEVSLINNEHTFNIKKDTVVLVKFKDKVVDKYFKLTLPENVSADVLDLNKIKEGTSVVLTINIPKGKNLDELKVDGKVVEVVLDTYTFVIKKDTEVLVTFKDIVVDNYYKLTLPDNVSADVSDLNRIKEGTSIVLTIDIPEGMKLKELKIDGIIVDVNDDTYTFIIRKDTVVTVLFEEAEIAKDTFKLTLPEGVRAYGYSDLDNIPKGTKIDLSIRVGNEEVVSSFKINGVETKYINRSHTFKISEDTIVEITYSESTNEKVKITFSREVSIYEEVLKEYEVLKGSQVIFTIHDRKEYEFIKSIYVNGILLPTNEYSMRFMIMADDNYDVDITLGEYETINIKLPEGITIDDKTPDKLIKGSYNILKINIVDNLNIKKVIMNGKVISFSGDQYSFIAEEDIEIEIFYYPSLGNDYTLVGVDETIKLFENLDPQLIKEDIRNQFKRYRILSDGSIIRNTEFILNLDPDLSKRDFYLTDNGYEVIYFKNNELYHLDRGTLYRSEGTLSDNIINDILYGYTDSLNEFEFDLFYKEAIIDYIYYDIILANIDYDNDNLEVFKKDNYYKIDYKLKDEETSIISEFYSLINFTKNDNTNKDLIGTSYDLEIQIKDFKITSIKSVHNYGNETEVLEYNEYDDEIYMPYEFDLEDVIEPEYPTDDLVDYEIYEEDKLISSVRGPREYLKNIYADEFYKNGKVGEGFYYDRGFAEPVDFDNLVGDKIKVYIKYKDIFSIDDIRIRVNSEVWGFRDYSKYYFENSDYIYLTDKGWSNETIIVKDKHTNIGYYINIRNGVITKSFTNADYFLKDLPDVKEILSYEYVLLANKYFSKEGYRINSENRIYRTYNNDKWRLELFNQKELDEFQEIDIEDLIKDVGEEEVSHINFNNYIAYDIRGEQLSDDVVFDVIYKTGNREKLTLGELKEKHLVTITYPTSERWNLEIKIGGIKVGSVESYDSNKGPLIYLNYKKVYLDENPNLFEDIEYDDFYTVKGIQIGDVIYPDMQSLYNYFEDVKVAKGSVIYVPKNLEQLKNYLEGKIIRFNLSYSTYDYDNKTLIYRSGLYKNKIVFSEEGYYVYSYDNKKFFPNNEFGQEIFYNYVKEGSSSSEEFLEINFILLLLGKIDYTVNEDETINYQDKTLLIRNKKIYLDDKNIDRGENLSITNEMFESREEVFTKQSIITNNINEYEISIYYNDEIKVYTHRFKYKDMYISKFYKIVGSDKEISDTIKDSNNYYMELAEIE